MYNFTCCLKLEKNELCLTIKKTMYLHSKKNKYLKEMKILYEIHRFSYMPIVLTKGLVKSSKHLQKLKEHTF